MTDAVTLSEYTQAVSAGTGALFLLSAVRSFMAPLASRVLHKLATAAMATTIAFGVATYAQRWADVGHVPTQTFWEALIMAALCAQVAFAKGEELLRDYLSSEGTHRRYCGRCGTRMTFESGRGKWAEEVHPPLAVFATPVDREPHANAFAEERPPWAPFHDAG